MDKYKGYSVDQLRAAFNAVKDPDDWRGPIAATMTGESVMVTAVAIEFFTATVAKIELDVTSMRYIVTSIGYRAGPAGP